MCRASRKLLSSILFIQEDDTLNGRVDDTPEARQITILRQVKAEKEQDSSSLYKHIGYKVCIILHIFSYRMHSILFTNAIFLIVCNMW